MITDEDVRRVIEETIRFDEMPKDPEAVKQIELEVEKIRNIDLRQYFKED